MFFPMLYKVSQDLQDGIIGLLQTEKGYKSRFCFYLRKRLYGIDVKLYRLQ